MLPHVPSPAIWVLSLCLLVPRNEIAMLLGQGQSSMVFDWLHLCPPEGQGRCATSAAFEHGDAGRGTPFPCLQFYHRLKSQVQALSCHFC